MEKGKFSTFCTETRLSNLQPSNQERPSIATRESSRDISAQTDPMPETEVSIKQEVENSETIAMPNIPNSAPVRRPKKRKISKLTATRRSAPSEATSSNSEMESATVNENETESSRDKYASDSKVYEKYCDGFAMGGNEEALKRIKGMKSCLWFKAAGRAMYKFDLEKTLKQIGNKLWKAIGFDSPQSDTHRGIIHSMMLKISVTWSDEFETKFTVDGKSSSTFNQLNSMTRILIILPNGYEFWYIKDFDKVPGLLLVFISMFYGSNLSYRLFKTFVTKPRIRDLEYQRGIWVQD